MMDSWKKQLGSTHLLIILLSIAVSIYLLQMLWQVLGIFSDAIIVVFSAWIVSFILEPLVERVKNITKLPKTASAGIVYTLFFGLLIVTVVLFIPAFTYQMTTLTKLIPKYVGSFPIFVNQFTSNSVGYIQNSLPLIPSVAQFLFTIFIVLIISFYFVVDKDHMQKELYNLVPTKWRHHADFFGNLVEITFGSFLRVQLVFGIVAGIATWIVLRALGIEFAASTAVLSGILTTIPLLGPILGIIPPVFVAFLTDPTRALIIFLILLAMQQVLFNIVGPKLLGNALKLHPVVVLLSFIVGYKLLGPLGAVFAVPVLGILVVILHRMGRHFLANE